MRAIEQSKPDEIKMAARKAVQCSSRSLEVQISTPNANVNHARLACPQIQTISGAAPYRQLPPITLRMNAEPINHQCQRGTELGHDRSPPTQRLSNTTPAIP